MPASRNNRSRRSRRKRLVVVPLEPIPPFRLRLVFGIICLGLIGLTGRATWLQVFQAKELESRARAFQTHRIQPLGTRRSIVDRRGRLVAFDEERFRLWAHPRYFNFPGDETRLIRSPDDVARKLSGPLSMPVSELVSLMGDRISGVKLAEGVDSEIASEIKKLGISGIDLEPYPQRFYPQGDLFANVVGFLNQDRIPQGGLELSLNKKLLRQEQTLTFRRGADGTPLPDGFKPGTFVGDNLRLHLTLDARLQELAVEAVASQVHEWKAKKGVAIVMDVTNGEILALASTPTYDPNSYWNYSPALFREWSVQDLFEPGSTFKPINLALALQEGAIQSDGTVNDTGKLNIGGWSIYNHDSRANGVINYAKVLQVSSNVGMVNAMSKLEPSLFWDWLHRLEIDVQPDTDLPGAVAGHLKKKDHFINHPIEPATASFGQGFSLTPLKLLQLHALIANDGYLVSPHITKGLREGEGGISSFSASRRQILRPEVTRVVRSWMESVVDKGSGMGVKTFGYRIGGKTGTAQKAVNGQYQPGAKTCSFVANLPADKPRYVVLVVIDEPQGGNAYGSTVAVPVAKKIIDAILVLEKIPPSSEETNLQPAKRQEFTKVSF